MDSKDWDRISQDYYSEILSPLNDSEQSPLYYGINKASGQKKTVIDLGCGLGELSGYLSKRFKKVVGIDFSPKMIDQAKKKNADLKNTDFFVADLNNLKKFYNKFDVAISINSIIIDSTKAVDKILEEIFKVLKPGGKLFAVLPSMEVYLFESILLVDEKLAKGKTQKQARKKAKKLINPKEHDFLLGTITFDGDTEKCFYGFEIPYRFRKAGFTNIILDKVLYTWKEFRKAGQVYFKHTDHPWDWYASCTRSKISRAHKKRQKNK